MRAHIVGRFLPVVAVVAALASCKSEKPDAFVYAMVDSVNGKPQAMWNALPASYQADAKGLVTAFAAKMDPAMWDGGFALLKKAVKVAQDKKAFILEQPQARQMNVKPEDYDAFVKILATIANSELSTHAGLKGLDVEGFLSGTMAGLMTDVIKASEVAAKATKGPQVNDQLTKLKNVKTSVESIDGDKAKVKIEQEGEPAKVEEFVKVEGKWIPKELADAWAPTMQKAKAAINEFKIEPAMAATFTAMTGAIDATLDKLLATKTADEFNTQLGLAMQGFMGGGMAKAPEAAPAPEAAAAPEPPAKKGKNAKGKKKARR